MNPQLAVAITGKNMVKPAFDSVVVDAQRASTAIAAVGGRAGHAMGDAGFATANLAAQFNDIGVMLASGQSPLLLAIQQGTQISQVLGPMKAGAAVQALKTALLSLLSPVTLITIGSIAAGAALFQWLTSSNEVAETASESLKRHQAVLVDVVRGYSTAEDAVNAYFLAADRIPKSVAASQVNAQFAAMASETAAFGEKARWLGDLFDGVGSQAEQALSTAARRFADGSTSAEEFYLELQGVTEQFSIIERSPMGHVIRGMVDEFSQGAIKALQYGDALNNLIAQSHALAGLNADSTLTGFFDENSVEKSLEALKSLTPELRTQQEIVAATYEKAISNPALTDAAREKLASARDEALAAIATAESRLEGAKASRTASREIEGERKAVADLIEQLEHEQSLIGTTNTEKEVSNALRQAGAAATDEERARIESLVTAINRQEEAQKAQEAAWKQVGNAGVNAIDGIAAAMDDGTVTGQEWLRIILQLGKGLSQLDWGALGGGGGGVLSWLFGGGGGVGRGRTGAQTFGGGGGHFGVPGFAEGTGSAAPGWAIVGEQGPELMKMGGSETVIPTRSSLGALAGAGSKGAPSVKVEIHNYSGQPVREETRRGADGSEIKRFIIGTLKEAFAGGGMDPMMGSLYGLDRKGR